MNVSVLSSEKRLRFRIRKGDFEVELEGDHDYVRERFEDLEKSLGPTGSFVITPQLSASPTPTPEQSVGIAGIVEFTSEGKPHLTVPVDTLSAKETISLVVFSMHPKPLGDDDHLSLFC